MCEGQPTKHAQPNKESGKNSPIGRNGGVVCSDLKGLMVPVERKGNQYMVKFVDHLINYGRVSVAKKKDKLQHQTEPDSTNPNRVSPLEVLTGEKPKLADIAVFSTFCMVYRGPSKKARKFCAEHIQNVETLGDVGNE
ncbi:hypothetical protein PC110_g4291 [Phytophthora cactorum]|uniref:Uncharacterized protein n=1 Tax=Phytophthora cactorum TaxID=29920 RepID=A0A329SRE3_9STRA|nr:hypothetical protein PC110_g4291 [Phytophthora cactorum]